jgi:hypothetical protein
VGRSGMATILVVCDVLQIVIARGCKCTPM